MFVGRLFRINNDTRSNFVRQRAIIEPKTTRPTFGEFSAVLEGLGRDFQEPPLRVRPFTGRAVIYRFQSVLSLTRREIGARFQRKSGTALKHWSGVFPGETLLLFYFFALPPYTWTYGIYIYTKLRLRRLFQLYKQ